jgi:predicted Zn-dependent protease with MMP-like domain
VARRDPSLRDPAVFERLVTEALDRIPEEFRRHLRNVVVTIAEEPTPGQLLEADLDPDDDTLYGLYEGTPLPDRPHDYAGRAPDTITIFRRPLVRDCATAEDLRDEVEITVVHEIAHFFGFDDAELERLGY